MTQSVNLGQAAYTLKYNFVACYRLTPENLDVVAELCNGSVRGTKLPAADRVVQFTFDGEEKEIQVGDWLVIFNAGNSYNDVPEFEIPVVFTNNQFCDIFKPIKIESGE